MCLHRPILAVVRDHSYINLSDWRCKDTIFLFCSYAICDICVDSGKKVRENDILCLILKFEEIFPKNRKLSPKDKIISPKDKMISPKEIFLLIIYPGTDCCRWFSVACRTEFWMWFLGGEGEGCIFNLYIIFFILGFFRFLTLGSFFRFLPLPFTRIYKKEFSNLHPSPFWRFFWWSESYGWRVVKALLYFL